MGKRKAAGSKGPGQPRNPKQPHPADPTSVEAGVMVEMRALVARLVALEHTKGLLPQPGPPQGLGSGTQYTR